MKRLERAVLQAAVNELYAEMQQSEEFAAAEGVNAPGDRLERILAIIEAIKRLIDFFRGLQS